ncbi:MAG: hypothetical protein EZS28_013072 [Streblomastix strix]|uniref:Uncharacterized protein n=1 Tax=Streblomastix strix TaxID=222440 RepID=A0A5J4W905_9EUKA|nr:MAG: hypothetical protein EZS28_013072 [Streblomastix strix]
MSSYNNNEVDALHEEIRMLHNQIDGMEQKMMRYFQNQISDAKNLFLGDINDLNGTIKQELSDIRSQNSRTFRLASETREITTALQKSVSEIQLVEHNRSERVNYLKNIAFFILKMWLSGLIVVIIFFKHFWDFCKPTQFASLHFIEAKYPQFKVDDYQKNNTGLQNEPDFFSSPLFNRINERLDIDGIYQKELQRDMKIKNETASSESIMNQKGTINDKKKEKPEKENNTIIDFTPPDTPSNIPPPNISSFIGPRTPSPDSIPQFFPNGNITPQNEDQSLFDSPLFAQKPNSVVQPQQSQSSQNVVFRQLNQQDNSIPQSYSPTSGNDQRINGINNYRQPETQYRQSTTPRTQADYARAMLAKMGQPVYQKKK